MQLNLLDLFLDLIKIDLFLNFLLAVLSSLTVYGVYGLMKKPRIEVKPTWMSRGSNEEPSRFKGDEGAFYHISIINKGRFSNPARNARVKLTFYRVNKERSEKLFTIPAKWDFRPEPIRFEINGKIIPEPAFNLYNVSCFENEVD